MSRFSIFILEEELYFRCEEESLSLTPCPDGSFIIGDGSGIDGIEILDIVLDILLDCDTGRNEVYDSFIIVNLED